MLGPICEAFAVIFNLSRSGWVSFTLALHKESITGRELVKAASIALPTDRIIPVHRGRGIANNMTTLTPKERIHAHNQKMSGLGLDSPFYALHVLLSWKAEY